MTDIYILGNGAMASALACGLQEKYQVYIIGRDEKKLTDLEKQGFKTLLYKDFSLENKNVILAFKPYALKDMANILNAQARILISVLANVSFDTLKCIKAQNYVRIMPNIAAKYKASATPYLIQNSYFKDEIIQILQTFGNIYELKEEKQMNAAMAISGCAPAFLALIAESIADGGVNEGLDRDLSIELTQGLFESFAQLLSHKHPALIKEKICSPAGVTIKGVRTLEKYAIRSAFIEALNSSSS
ncbi:pyrroline-5-carboxylate reductase [Campylobacter novaezeelandiae]|uniref:Pyrroline-5-carboxylate reductase n=1 Tax=Campylobacter novaezeelandiae TaxID=2267891 RepID=A0A4Q9JUN6_9BACT|nr:pyrroline-5-carboxylate reductase [Campylobacter novaezeelandiae]TBR81156.1 pyrroline-5-carboxylate reductase [Campylobacter novaezeelandiae]